MTEHVQFLRASKSDGFSTVLMVGVTVFGGGSFAYGIFQIIRSEPDKAFDLLKSWGPGFLLAIFIAWCVSNLFNRGLDVTVRTGDRSAAAMEGATIQMQSIAEAMHAQALALQSTADRDDRDKQEMQILVGVVNSKVEQALEELKFQRRTFERIEEALNIRRPQESE